MIMRGVVVFLLVIALVGTHFIQYDVASFLRIPYLSLPFSSAGAAAKQCARCIAESRRGLAFCVIQKHFCFLYSFFTDFSKVRQ